MKTIIPIKPGQICWRSIYSLIFAALVLGRTAALSAESIAIGEFPAKLPQTTALGQYSPPLSINYSGLAPGVVYTLRGWLLVPGPWYCASSVWCERTATIDNSSGTNSAGTLWWADNMDIYAYSQFDWVFRLYNSGGSEVTWTELYVAATDNRAPVLSPIGSRTVVLGQSVNFILQGTDSEGSSLAYGATNIPAGSVLNPTSGQFTWTPTNTGSFGPAIFWVQDAGDGSLRDAEMVQFDVIAAPNIITNPVSTVSQPGGSVTFRVFATSSTPLTYQWRFNGTNIAGATAATLTLNNLTTNQGGGYSVLVSNSAGTALSADAVLTVVVSRTPIESTALSLQWLRDRMDETHNGFQVYTDISAAGNHFHARGQLPDQTSTVGIFGSATNRPHSGATCTRCTFTNSTGANFGGFYFLNGYLYNDAPVPYFGEPVVAGTSIAVTNPTGYDLTGATQLTGWVRGEIGGEVVELFMGGVGRDLTTGITNQPYPDSTARHSISGTRMQLTTNWQQFSINLAGANLTNIMGGFGWVADAAHNPNGAAFYLDDITYLLSATTQSNRYSQPRFIRSFRTRSIQPNVQDANLDDDIDLVLRNVAFTYDNALALLAFVADGSSDSLRRAKLIADAFVYALNHDRTYTNGCVRTAFQAGDLPLPPGWVVNGKKGTVAVPGFYLESPPQFTEVENANIDTGNNAWAMIALLAAHRQFGGTNYLYAARRVGQFIQSMRVDTGTFPGFRGGINNAEGTNPVARTYASTEHNLDSYAVFSEMYRLTGETQWLVGANVAGQFVESMFDTNNGNYLTGTTGGTPDARNIASNQLPVDTQTWSVLAIPGTLQRHPSLLAIAESTHRVQSDGFDGYDFNNDRDGVWFEGSGQMAVAYALAQNPVRVDQLRATLQSGQQIPAPYGDGMGTPAASHDGVTSGFDFKLFRRPHVGATAWNIFAQMGFNPYYATRSPIYLTINGFDSGKRFGVRVNCEPGKTNVLQRSSDMAHWLSVGTNSSAYGEVDFLDASAKTNRATYYRAYRPVTP